MAVEHELFREVLGADSQRLREAASQNRDGGGRFAERSHCSSLSARTCAPTFRKNDPNRVHRGTSPLYAPANCSAPIRDAAIEDGRNGRSKSGGISNANGAMAEASRSPP